MKKIIKGIFSAVIVLVLLVAVFHASLLKVWLEFNQSKQDISNVSTSTMDRNEAKEGQFDFSAIRPVSALDIAKAQMANQNYPAIGGVAVPELGINLPIFKGIEFNELMFGAGTLKADQKMGKGNYVLASHHIFGGWGSEELLFGPLMKAQNGMSIYLTDKEKVYRYEVTSVQQTGNAIQDEKGAKSGNILYDNEGLEQVTLIACWDENAVNRIVVQGDLVETTDFDDSQAEIFTSDYKQNG